jgi:superfamily II DNA helicase RecQ
MDNACIERLWKNHTFTSHITYFVFDEGHCIRLWGNFRKAYLNVGTLWYLIPQHIPCYVASATLPDAILDDVINILQLQRDKIEYVLHSNE